MNAKDLPGEIARRLVELGVVAEGVPLQSVRLTGGVSSDIWKVTAGADTFCVKRAMAKLAVADDWFAPVERNHYEHRWYDVAARRVPGVAPAVIAVDDAAGLFVMEWLDPGDHRLWKPELLAGRVDVGFAAAVGRSLAAVHGATAGDRALAAEFAAGPLFEALRLDPYLRQAGRRHATVRDRLETLADHTASTARALVHGDVSPKNIMIGPASPVFLDAECATYGDPAFDLAFCLNHLLLKCLAVPEARVALLDAFDALRGAYVSGVTWEPAGTLEARAAALLPGLLLARVDGKSPVEYLSGDAMKKQVRRVAIPLLREAPERLSAVRSAWEEGMRP